MAELLAPFGVDEEDFVAALSHDLHRTPEAAASRLTLTEERLLREHGGVVGSAGEAGAVGQAVLRSVSSNLAEQTRTSITVEQAARLLGVDGSRVRHRVRDRALYGFKIGAALRLPTWQFTGNEPLPGLRAVLAALPAGLHPLEVTGFMTTPDPDLTLSGEPTSPRDWLAQAGAVSVVTDLAVALDTW